MIRRGTRQEGFSLLELLFVLTVIGVLLAISGWGSAAALRDWQVQRAAHQLLEDLKAAQRQAELRGSTTLSNGQLNAQRSFLVFSPENLSYALYAWQDSDGSGTPQAGESTFVWRQRLPPGVTFGWSAGVDRKACSNPPEVPTTAITFASPDYPPCDDRPCIKFDSQGTSEIGPGAIYLNNGDQSYALSVTRPGLFTLCKWKGTRWE
jgi:prepilin-type N-terminal cleavage/methylation domain-containing protein